MPRRIRSRSKKGNRLIILQPGSKTAKVNGAKIAIVAAPVLIGGVPYVPLRFVAESLGASLSWNASTGAYEVNTRLHPFEQGGYTSFVNVFGESVIGATYGTASAFSGGLSLLQQGDSFGYVDRGGKIAIPVQYSSAYDFSDGLALVASKDGTQSYIDKSGKVVLSPAYDELFDFSEGLAAVRSGDSFGYIDKTGKLVIPAQYEDAFYFSGGLAAVQIGGRLRLYRQDGQAGHSREISVRIGLQGWSGARFDARKHGGRRRGAIDRRVRFP
ncbi:WG repeat-containing protein [Cohnella rhizosphaerae]|uniref:WG repeat-containing protein n=1 Tax=Cohnella rhizosphaerae TaxID=1457232 RepID=A0A9X4KRV8_9BACL|nr:WG repeat-containing protein [Cohnella rhizosphaerae]MDG0809687.1 WG repeat-containing protein [Cohnella rhizosphaerae]